MFQDYPLKFYLSFCLGENQIRSIFLVNILSVFKQRHTLLKYRQIQSCITHHLKPQNATDKRLSFTEAERNESTSSVKESGLEEKTSFSFYSLKGIVIWF